MGGHCLAQIRSVRLGWRPIPGPEHNPFKLIARQNKPFTKCLSDTTANMRIWDEDSHSVRCFPYAILVPVLGIMWGTLSKLISSLTLGCVGVVLLHFSRPSSSSHYSPGDVPFVILLSVSGSSSYFPTWPGLTECNSLSFALVSFPPSCAFSWPLGVIKQAE